MNSKPLNPLLHSVGTAGSPNQNPDCNHTYESLFLSSASRSIFGFWREEGKQDRAHKTNLLNSGHVWHSCLEITYCLCQTCFKHFLMFHRLWLKHLFEINTCLSAAACENCEEDRPLPLAHEFIQRPCSEVLVSPALSH